MTIKRKRIYEIALIACCCVIIALTAYMGITAIQKSMKLNLGFAANPIVYCQILVNDEVVFDNSAQTIKNGVSLSGNVLTFDAAISNNATYGENFNLQIKNHSTTESALHISFTGATISGSEEYSEIVETNAISTKMSVSTTTAMQIVMTKVTPVTLSLGDGVTIESSNLITATSGAQCLPLGEDLEATISLEANYDNPTFVFNGNTYPITNNQLTIPAEDLTGKDVSVEVGAEQLGFTITFATNNWSAKIGGQETTSISVDPGTDLTAILAGSGTQEGYSVHTITGMGANDTYDRYTGTLTLNNIQSNLTISATDFRPWTYGAYASGHVWEGYKYITFANNSTYKSNFNSGSYDLNWIIIGANDNTNLGSAVQNTSEIPTNHVLLFSQYILTNQAYNNLADENCGWLGSDLRDYLNGTFLTDSGLSAYASYIKSDNTINTWWDDTNEVATNQTMFLLAYGGYVNSSAPTTSFIDETYLGSKYTDTRYTTFEGANTNKWWLRSGEYDDDNSMVYRSSSSNVGTNILYQEFCNDNYGVRPSFILNLA